MTSRLIERVNKIEQVISKITSDVILVDKKEIKELQSCIEVLVGRIEKQDKLYLELKQNMINLMDQLNNAIVESNGGKQVPLRSNPIDIPKSWNIKSIDFKELTSQNPSNSQIEKAITPNTQGLTMVKVSPGVLNPKMRFTSLGSVNPLQTK